MTSPPRTIYFVSLGCAKNRVDSEVMAGISREMGYTVVPEPELAEVIVVNTCAFVEGAKEESVAVLLEMAEHVKAGNGRLVVAGCMAQRYSEAIASELPEVTHLLGTSELDRIADILAGSAERIEVGARGHYLQTVDTPRYLEPNAVSAYVKIADGCSRKCAFCAIPGIRGKARSRPMVDVVKEAERLARAGIKELNLVAQDTSAYGRDLGDGTGLVDLLRRLDPIPGIRWVRLLYLYPDAVSDELIETINTLPRVVPYLDIPVQHAAAGMLKRMRRGHGPAALKQLIRRVRTAMPDAFIRTAVLVGHPGETRSDFEALLRFVEWARFDYLGAFRYSNEEGTASFDMSDHVSKRDSYNRFRKIMATQRRVSRERNRRLLGTTLEVLVEEAADDMGYVQKGRHAGQAPEVDGATYLVSSRARPGDFISARVVQVGDFDLVAEQI